MARLNGKLNGWRPAVPRLAEAGPASPVEVSYDPEVFAWCDEPSRFTANEMAISISPDKHEIRLFSAAGRKIVELAEEKGICNPKGRYQVEIGIAPKAMAIRLLPPGGRGFCLRQKSTRKSMVIHSARLIEDLRKAGWPLDHKIRMPAFWDEKNKMLVGKRSE